MRIVKHPTGFIKVVFGSIFGHEFRLHIWPKGYLNVLSDIHDHRCRVLSLPLIGRFVEARYEQVRGEDCAVICCADNGDILEDGGRGSVETRQIFWRRALVPYIIGLDTIHSFQPLSRGLHVTAVIFGRRHKARARVFRREEACGA